MSVSSRLVRTSPPIVVTMGRLLQRASPNCLSLAQGQVYWEPPETAVTRAQKAIKEPKTSRYGPDEGAAELRDALSQMLNLQSKEKLMITQGANQAIFNALLATTDANQAVGLLTPYYFNHHMAISQLSCRVHLIPRLESMHPDVPRIEKALINGQLKALIITNPCNPTGTIVPSEDLKQIADLCKQHRCALILDNTYEDFVYRGTNSLPKERLTGPGIFNIFSFSKNYGMSGWRMGYMTYNEQFADALLKIQDTVVICPTQIAQQAALGALESGKTWIAERVAMLQETQEIVRSALTNAGIQDIAGGEGAIYLFAKLPEIPLAKQSLKPPSSSSRSSKKQEKPSDALIAERLVLEHDIAVIPGSSCGMPGWIRICFANLPKDKCTEAAGRLERGLVALCSNTSELEKP